jgi:hypothetical protein
VAGSSIAELSVDAVGCCAAEARSFYYHLSFPSIGVVYNDRFEIVGSAQCSSTTSSMDLTYSTVVMGWKGLRWADGATGCRVRRVGWCFFGSPSNWLIIRVNYQLHAQVHIRQVNSSVPSITLVLRTGQLTPNIFQARARKRVTTIDKRDQESRAHQPRSVDPR